MKYVRPGSRKWIPIPKDITAKLAAAANERERVRKRQAERRQMLAEARAAVKALRSLLPKLNEVIIARGYDWELDTLAQLCPWIKLGDTRGHEADGDHFPKPPLHELAQIEGWLDWYATEEPAPGRGRPAHHRSDLEAAAQELAVRLRLSRSRALRLIKREGDRLRIKRSIGADVEDS